MQSGALGFPATTVLTLMILGLSGACGASVTVTSQPEEREGDDRRLPVLRALDTDGDRALSAGEIDAAAESLAALDADGDGRLSGGELRSRPRVVFGSPADLPEGARTITLDARDGSVDLSEVPPEARELLSGGDTDGDGAASAAELLAFMAAAAQGGGAPGAADGNPRVRAPLMAALDADQDGTVSASEIESAPRSLRALDSDGDGRLSPAELQPDASSGSPPE